MGGQTGRGATVSTGGKDDGARGPTSPSHLFLPLRQLVQARAPRFGMCEDGTEDEPWAGDASCGEPMSERAPFMAAAAVKLVVRRRFPLGWSS